MISCSIDLFIFSILGSVLCHEFLIIIITQHTNVYFLNRIPRVTHSFQYPLSSLPTRQSIFHNLRKKITITRSSVFMPPTRRAPEALCFRVVRPSGCPSVRTRISLTRNLKNPWVDFHHTWPRGAPWRVDELIRFWGRSAQGQRSMNLV